MFVFQLLCGLCANREGAPLVFVTHIKYDEQFHVVFEVLNELMAAPEPKRKPIGFSVKERRARYSAHGIRHT